MRKAVWGALLVMSCACMSAAVAQSYPVKPIRIIVPYPPGGATDIFARLLGAKFTENMGQQVVVENRPGATGNIGAEVTARSAPDGYTVFVGQASNLAINVSLMRKMPYDPVKDFAPISLIASMPNLLVVHPSLPVQTIKDLVALAKSKPGVINYASSGSGSPGHLAAAYFNKVAHIDMVHIPYKGASPALADVVAGQASLYFTSPLSAQPFVKAGRLRMVAVTSTKRFALLPDVPAIAESGYPEIDITSWWGLLAPAGVPKEILSRLHAETVGILKTPDMKERLSAQGAEVVTTAPDEFAAFIKAEIAKWALVIKASGARPE